MSLRFLSIILLYILGSTYVVAVECSAIFPDGAQSNNNGGKITFYSNGNIANNPDTQLITSQIVDYSSGFSCGSADCSISNSVTATANYNSFPNNGNSSITYNSPGNYSLSPSDGYDVITINKKDTVLTLAPGDYKRLTVNAGDGGTNHAIVELSAGDYTFSDTLTLNNSSEIRITGAGVVRVFVKKAVALNSGKMNTTGNAQQLLLYGKDNINFYSGSSFTGFAYSAKQIDMQGPVTGALNAKDVIINGNTLAFESTVPDFGDFCEGSAPTLSCDADSAFSTVFTDDFSTAKSWQTVDFNRSISNWPGDTVRTDGGEESSVVFEMSSNLKVAGNAQAGGHNEYGMVGYNLSSSSLDSTAATHYSLFTAVNAKANSNNNDVGIVFGFQNDENYYIARWTKYGSTYSGSNNFPGVHRNVDLIKVSAGVATSLDSVSSVELGNDFSMKVIVQDDGTAVCTGDTDGSNMTLRLSSTEQPILNELGLFSYDNDAGISYDDVEVKCDDCTPSIVVVADIRFDEIGWSGANPVIDSSGNNYHGTPTNSSPSQGLMCNAANLTPVGSSDYISIDPAAMNGLDDFTISVWGKSTNIDGQTLLSAANNLIFNELVMLFDNSNNFEPYLNNVQGSDISISAINNGSWHHMVWTRAGTDSCLYIDGTLQSCATHATGSLAVENLILGQEQDSNGGGFQASEGWEGLIDELLIFKGAISASGVTSIYDNQLLAKNWDGSDRNSSCIAAWWALEENLLDSSPTNPHHLLASGSSDFGVSNPGPANTVGVESTCNYVSFDGSNYAEIDDSGDFNFQDLTVSAWVNPSSYGSSLRSIVSKDEHFEFHLNSSGRLFWWWRNPNGNAHTLTSSAVIGIDEWTHVAVVYDSSGTQSMYVNGVLDKSANFSDGLANTPCDFYIGTDVHTNSSTVCGAAIPARNFVGHIDEVRLYDRVLSAAEIVEDKNVVNACGSIGMDHYQIEHDGNGLTCEAETVKITACADPSCDNLHVGAISLDLQGDGVTKASSSITGSGFVSFNQRVANSALTLSINSNETPDNDLVCINGASNSCDMNFVDAAFQFLSNSTSVIPSQLSGKPSNIGYNSSTLELQAIRTNPITGDCEAALVNNVDVELSATCINPSNCATQQVVINNLATNKPIETIASAATASYTPVSLTFGNNTDDTAEFIFTYPDAGKVQLNARYNLPDSNGNPSGDYMVGSSNNFVVRPFGFHLNITDEPNGVDDDDHDGAVFKKAGEKFSTTLTAVQWQAADDDGSAAGSVANDGIPDSNDELLDNVTNNLITPNFGNEDTPESATITWALKLPLLGIKGDLTNTAFTNFNNGAVTQAEMTYSEVGFISLFANLTNEPYLDVVNGNVTGNVPYVGRFIPAYFQQSIEGSNTGLLDVNHGSSLTCFSKDWVYSGQTTSGIGAIQYEAANEPILTITAYNSLSPNAITQNYHGDFAKLLTAKTTSDLDDGVFFGNVNTTHTANSLAVTGDITALGDYEDSVSDNSVAQGSVTYTLPDSHHFTYTRNANSRISPFEAAFELPISSIQDSDGVFIKPTDVFPAPAEDKKYFMNPTFNEALNNTVNVRFGRWNIENAYGPEIENLTMPMALQYFSGNTFIPNTDEDCLVVNYGSAVTTGILNSGGLSLWDYRILDVSTSTNEPIVPSNTSVTTPSPLTAFDASSYRDFIFNAPGENKRGSLKIEYSVPDWLKYDWPQSGVGDNTFDDNPYATATFGLFRGNDRIISWREVAK